MSVFTRILGLDRQIQKALTPAIAQMFKIGFNGVVYSSNDTATLIEKAYETNVIYFSVIDRIAEKFGHLARYHYKESAKKKSYRVKNLDENQVDSDLSKLLLRPNNSQGQDQFFYLVGTSYKTCGEAIIWKNRGGLENGKVLELYVLPPWLVHHVSDGTLFGIKEYVLEIGGSKIILPKEDVIHWKKPQLSIDQTGTHLRGFNPLVPQKRTIQESNDIDDASVAMFQNGGARGLAFNKQLADLSPEQESKLDMIFDNKINNKDRKSSIVQAQGEWGYIDISKGAVDMQLIEADEKVIKKICFANGFPPELFQSDSTFANKEQAWYFFITNTLMPMAASLDGELNRSLLPDFKERGFVSTDFSELPEMQTMRLKSVEAAAKAWWLTPNEKRAMMMEEEKPEKEMNEVYIPQNLVPITEASMGKPNDDDVNTQDYE
jgi:HK97 family phage portal protein